MTMTQEVPTPQPITFDLLLRVFTDPKFIDQTREIVRISDEEFIESGFSVYKDLFSDDYHIYEIFKGSQDGYSMDNEENVYDPLKDPLLNKQNPYYPIIEIHCHDEGRITPSPFEDGKGDLYAWNMSRRTGANEYKFDNRGIDIICARAKQSRLIKLFLVQATNPVQLNEGLLEQVCEQIYGKGYCERDDLSEQEAKERFNKTNVYRAELMTLSEKGFSRRALERLRQFEYSPGRLIKL